MWMNKEDAGKWKTFRMTVGIYRMTALPRQIKKINKWQKLPSLFSKNTHTPQQMAALHPMTWTLHKDLYQNLWSRTMSHKVQANEQTRCCNSLWQCYKFYSNNIMTCQDSGGKPVDKQGNWKQHTVGNTESLKAHNHNVQSNT